MKQESRYKSPGDLEQHIPLYLRGFYNMGEGLGASVACAQLPAPLQQVSKATVLTSRDSCKTKSRVAQQRMSGGWKYHI